MRPTIYVQEAHALLGIEAIGTISAIAETLGSYTACNEALWADGCVRLEWQYVQRDPDNPDDLNMGVAQPRARDGRPWQRRRRQHCGLAPPIESARRFLDVSQLLIELASVRTHCALSRG